MNSKNQVTVIMYHYVRDLKRSRYFNIKGLTIDEFTAQLNYLSRFYTFIGIQDCIEAIYSEVDLPKNSVLLTFDDGFIDHFTSVYPILSQKKIQGCFFLPASVIFESIVLDVHKIHFILASTKSVNTTIIQDLKDMWPQLLEDSSVLSYEYYYDKLAYESRFDSKEIIFIKRLLQYELVGEVRKRVINKLFKKYVTNDEKSFSNELYLNKDHVDCMIKNGMFFGAHGDQHNWLDRLNSNQLKNEVDRSVDFLQAIGIKKEQWTMCYPYGAYNDSVKKLLIDNCFKLAFSTEIGIACLKKSQAFSLKRLDTNDLPKELNSFPNGWTKKVI